MGVCNDIAACTYLNAELEGWSSKERNAKRHIMFSEPPQVLRRCYAGCSSRLRAAWWADSYSLGVV